MKRILSVIAAAVLCVFLWGTAAAAEAPAAVPSEKAALLSALYEADISAIREAIQLKLISCEEVTRYYLDRIEACNKPYNCFITLCDDALETARAKDEQLQNGEAAGLLFGVPVVIKDNMDLAGYYTTNGHTTGGLTKKTDTAAVVSYLLEQGAVILGKTNMSTDAQDARVSASAIVGETKNAYNTQLAAGGSSGGTAVAVSLNFAAAGLGTDTNSSLRIPAALNGCVSLRPTTGLLSREGCTKLNGTRDTPGAITRTVYDQALMLDVLTNGAYGYTENLTDSTLKGLRIGILSELTYPQSNRADRKSGNFDTEVTAAFENAVAELKKGGADVITVSMPDLFSLSNATFSTSDAAPKKALYAAFEALLEEREIDAVIYPSYSSTPLRSGRDDSGKYWNALDQVFLNNCRTLSPSAGLPEISVPIGQHSSGAGIGMEIASLKNSEQLLLNIAYAYTGQTDHRAVPAGAPDAYADANEGSLRNMIDRYLQPVVQPEPEKTAGTTTASTAASAGISLPAQTPPDRNLWGLLWGIPGVFCVLAAVLGFRTWNKRRYRKRHARRRR